MQQQDPLMASIQSQCPIETTPLLHERPGKKRPLTLPPLKTIPETISTQKELKDLAWLGVPLCFSNVLEHTLSTASVFWVAQMGKHELAAASLASLTVNVCCFSVIQGMASALDTLCTQAFTSSHPKDTSLHAMRTAFIISCLLIPMFAILYNAEPIFLLLKQDPIIASMTAKYLRLTALSLPGFTLFEVLRKYSVSQGRAKFSSIVVTAVAPLNAFLNWFFVWRLYETPWLLGAPIATAISIDLMAIVMLGAVVIFMPRTAFGGFSCAVFHNLGENLVLGWDGVVSVASEWWIFELCSLAASFLDPSHFAAQSVMLITTDTFYNAASAASSAASVRIGNYIGGHHPNHAKLAAKAALKAAVILGALSVTILFLGRHVLASVLGKDPEVRRLIEKTLPWVSVFVFFDATSAVAEGILRGADRPAIAAKCSFASYYLGTIPIAALLTFGPLSLGLLGLWAGLIAAVVFETVVLTLIILRLPMKSMEEEETTIKTAGTKTPLSSLMRSALMTPRTPA